MKKSFMTRILATGLSLAMAFSMAAATNVTTASAASKPAMITSAGASAKSLSLKVGEVTKIKVNAATKANYKVSAVKASSKRVRAAVVGSTVVAIRGLKATVEGKPSTVKVSFKSRKTNKTSKFTYSSRVTVIEDKLTVTGVTATNGTTLTVTGTKLGDLVAADITVAGNLVSSYTAAEDGKTATVKIATSLVPDQDVKVTIKGVDYTVKYSIKADTIAIKDALVDNQRGYQYLSISANGADSSVSDLVANGYEVRFESFKADGMAKFALLDKDDNPATKESGDDETFNKTGLIASNKQIDLGTYKVRVVLTKGTTMVTSEYATVTVVDLDTLTSAINSVEGFIGTGARGDSKTLIKSTGDITLVNGEVLTVDIAEYVNEGKTYTIKSGFTKTTTSLATSNKPVASVTLDNQNNIRITASSVGSSTITITYGKVSKSFNVKVVDTTRYKVGLQLKSAPAKIVTGCTATYEYYVKDNHGGYRIGEEVIAKIADESKLGFASDAVTKSAIKTGIATFDIKAKNPGSTTVTFWFTNDAHAQTGSLLASVPVEVVDTDNATKNFKEVAIDAEGFVQKDTITELDRNTMVSRSKALILQYTEFAHGVVSGAVAVVSPATIKYNDQVVKVYAHSAKPTSIGALVPYENANAGTFVTNGAVLPAANLKYFTVVANGSNPAGGTTQINLETIGGDGRLVNIGSATVSVVNTTPYITGGTLKMTSINKTNVDLTLDKVLSINADGTVNNLNVTNAPNLSVKIKKDTGELYYENIGAADTDAKHFTLGYVKVAKNTGTFSGSLANVNKMYTLKTGATFNITSDQSGTINVYVDPSADNDVPVNAASKLLGTIEVTSI